MEKQSKMHPKMTNAPAPPFYAPPRWEGALIAVIGICAYELFAHVLGEGRGTVTGGFVTSFGAAIRIAWPLRKQLWFWVTIITLGAVHALTVIIFTWSASAKWTGLTFMPFMAADILLILGVIYLVYRWRCGVPAELVGEPNPRYADREHLR